MSRVGYVAFGISIGLYLISIVRDVADIRRMRRAAAQRQSTEQKEK